MLENLLGVWAGRGVAFYPTIETAHYREELTFRDHPNAPKIQYEQKTWRIHEDGSESVLHWEFGFLIVVQDDEIQWINAQDNGRVEVLQGRVALVSGILNVDVQSAAFANDPRMVASSRRVTVGEDSLYYLMKMSTTANPTMEAHLEADLGRVE